MIYKRLDIDTVAVTPEEPDDLLTLRRVIGRGDIVRSETVRVIKMNREYSRPDGGRKARIRIALEAERAVLGDGLDRLQVAGSIMESSSELVSRGSHHTLRIKPGDRLALTKRDWSGLHRRLLSSRAEAPGFVLAAIDLGECGIGRLRGTHLSTIPDIRSGYGGKRYRHSFNMEGFLGEARDAVLRLAGRDDSIIVFGPGQTKLRLAEALRAAAGGRRITVSEGIDTGGQDGIHVFTKSDSMREAISGGKLARVSSAIDEIMALAGKGSSRFSMGLDETGRAAGLGAVDTLIFSGRILEEAEEDAVVDVVNRAQSGGAATYSVDSSTDAGLRVDGLGGIAALLRFEVR